MGKIKSSLAAIGQNWSMTQKVYKFLWAEVLGIVLATIIVIAVPVSIFINWLTAVLIAIPMGLLAGTFWFSRRAMRAAYSRIEGQPGAAAAVIESLRGKWAVTPAVAVNRNQDMVSRVIGKPGVILVSEGAPTRVGHMLTSERKKTARWVPRHPDLRDPNRRRRRPDHASANPKNPRQAAQEPPRKRSDRGPSSTGSDRERSTIHAHPQGPDADQSAPGAAATPLARRLTARR